MPEILTSDYYAPAFSVKLEGSALDPKLKGSITSIKVTKAIDQSDYIEFDVQDQMENGAFVWLDKEALKIGDKLNVELGYTGNMSLKAEAHVQNVKTNWTSNLPPSFSIEGSHKAYNLLSKKNDMLSYSEKKDSDIVKDIAGQVGLSATVDATKITHKDKNTDGKKSFLEFIREMVKHNAGYEFFISEGTLYFRKAKISAGPLLTLKWGQHIENFSADVDLSKMITGVKVSSSDDKKNINVTVNAGVEKKIGSAGTLGSVAAKELGDKMESFAINSKNEAELKERATARLEEASSKYVVATVKTVGIPEIVPGVCVQLDGLGKEFSEKYYVYETTHTINSSGYKINFKARRNAI